MNDLVQLLTEARDQLHEIRKAITDSVGDYGLDVEIAIQFIDRALQTEGWTLVERLRCALGLDPESD